MPPIIRSDLALEAEFLAKLDHPNIIKLRGLTHSGAAGFANGPCGYFLIIDRLFETLKERIKRWHDPNYPGPKPVIPTASAKKGKISSIVARSIKALPTPFNTKVSREGVEVDEVVLEGDKVLDECLNVGKDTLFLNIMHEEPLLFVCSKNSTYPSHSSPDFSSLDVFALALHRLQRLEAGQHWI